jgi:hypothetical protein
LLKAGVRGPEEEGHKSAHLPTRYRLQREAGTAQLGGVERAGVAENRYCRLSVRYERRDDIHEAILFLYCSLICLTYLP